MDTSKPTVTIPTPPHPIHRQEKLPWQTPKPPEEDVEAQARVEVLLRSESYRQADEDIDFLGHDASRGVRLQLDYSKPQLLLNQHGVHHTIVVFGSTRIMESAAADRKVDLLNRELRRSPENSDLKRRLAVAKRIQAKSQYYQIARDFGRMVGESGRGPEDCRVVVMTGGGPGIMEAANRGAFDCGAKNIGLNITLPQEQYPNPYLTPDLCFRFHYFALRKMHFLLRARALVAFPGGFGTFDELFETLTLIQTRTITPLPVILVGQRYWEHAVNFDFLIEEGVIDLEDRELFWFAETAKDIWEGILRWHEANGSPLLDPHEC
ncbi:MAG: TIGR00730 family Rossman fold protein [Nitrospira sp.]|nr:TIGR00730 family Rossman fold protein [Nitrospira sp.]